METDSKSDPGVFDANFNNLMRDKENISGLRNRLVSYYEGTTLMKIWSEYGEDYRYHPEHLKETQRKALDDIAPWFEAE